MAEVNIRKLLWKAKNSLDFNHTYPLNQQTTDLRGKVETTVHSESNFFYTCFIRLNNQTIIEVDNKWMLMI